MLLHRYVTIATLQKIGTEGVRSSSRMWEGYCDSGTHWQGEEAIAEIDSESILAPAKLFLGRKHFTSAQDFPPT
jgi:hypothetical protein